MKTLILASKSPSRRRMLEAAGVPHKAVTSPADEEKIKADARAQGSQGPELALRLADAKAFEVAVALGHSHPPILGCDQVLVCDDGTMLDKAANMGELAEQLRRLSGRTHRLYSAAVIVEDYVQKWAIVDSARMEMRTLSDGFIADYLAQEGETLLGCVGGYKIEGRGAQLFSAVEGSQFVVQGLPLLPLLDYLRTRKHLQT